MTPVDERGARGVDVLSLRRPTGAPVTEDAVALVPGFDALADLQDSGELRAPVAPPGPGARSGRLSPSALYAAEERRNEQRRTLEAGKGHPTHFTVLREAKRLFAPGREALRGAIEAHAGKDASAGRWLMRYLGGWATDKARDPVTGEAFDPREGGVQLRRGLSNAAQVYHTRVCAAFAEAAAPTLSIDKSSGVPALDDLAVQSVKRAAMRLADHLNVPPSQACYLFVTELTRIPPAPVLACFIGGKDIVSCQYPLKQIFKTSIRLDGISYPG